MVSSLVSSCTTSSSVTFHVFVAVTAFLMLLQQVCRVRPMRFELSNETIKLKSFMNMYEESGKDISVAAISEDSPTNHLQSPDFYERKTVQISNAVIKPLDNVDKSWPPANAQEFSRIDITVMGKRVDGATLNNIVPDLSKMSSRALRKILQPNFNTQWMSINKPAVLSAQQKLKDPFEMDPKLTRLVDELNFTMEDDLGTKFLPNANMVHMMKVWLLRQVSCPLEYLWEDLGVLFWPRWIKRGMCSMSHSCSWPPGMHCKPSSSRTVSVLRWVCTEDERQEGRQYRRSNQESAPPKTKHSRVTGKRKSAAAGRARGRRRRRNKITTVKEMIATTDVATEKLSGWERRKERRQIRKRRRLMRKLSRRVGSYTCQWMIAEYPVTDKCSCMCH